MNKRELWVYFPLTKIRYPYVLVYSYLCKQAKFGKLPSQVQIAYSTGLTRQTISNAMTALYTLDLYNPETKATLNKDGAFRRKKNLGRITHFSDRFTHWKLYIPSKESPLSLTDSMVYSYLFYALESSWQPKHWSFAYVAKLICLDQETVKKCLDNLTKYRLFQFDERNQWIVNSNPSEFQQSWFADPYQPKCKELSSFSISENEDEELKRLIATKQEVKREYEVPTLPNSDERLQKSRYRGAVSKYGFLLFNSEFKGLSRENFKSVMARLSSRIVGEGFDLSEAHKEEISAALSVALKEVSVSSAK